MHIVVSREDYFDSAMQLLSSDGGASNIKIGRLCKSLHVTSGSFYGYFGSLQGFIEQFLIHWERIQTERLVEIVDADEDPVARILEFQDRAGDLPHEAEAAIRGWAQGNELVASVQTRVDARRVELISDHLVPIVGVERAKVLATMGLTLFIGFQQWHRRPTRAEYDVLFAEYRDHVFANALPEMMVSLDQIGGHR